MNTGKRRSREIPCSVRSMRCREYLKRSEIDSDVEERASFYCVRRHSRRSVFCVRFACLSLTTLESAHGDGGFSVRSQNVFFEVKMSGNKLPAAISSLVMAQKKMMKFYVFNGGFKLLQHVVKKV